MITPCCDYRDHHVICTCECHDLPSAGDEPDVWHNGGWVCRACGEPTETVPCEQHQPIAWAEMGAEQ